MQVPHVRAAFLENEGAAVNERAVHSSERHNRVCMKELLIIGQNSAQNPRESKAISTGQTGTIELAQKRRATSLRGVKMRACSYARDVPTGIK